MKFRQIGNRVAQDQYVRYMFCQQSIATCRIGRKIFLAYKKKKKNTEITKSFILPKISCLFTVSPIILCHFIRSVARIAGMYTCIKYASAVYASRVFFLMLLSYEIPCNYWRMTGCPSVSIVLLLFAIIVALVQPQFMLFLMNHQLTVRDAQR